MWDIKTLKREFNLNKLYKEYNTKYFKGKLGDVVFDVYTQGKDEILSYACENAHKKRNGGYSANIKFNVLCEWNNENISKVLLHEMIHYYLYTKFGNSLIIEHGILYIIIQLKILIRYGIYVPLSFGHLIKIKKG